MQIRISDMLDNASELIEENREVRNTTNNDRIKKMVFSEIDCTPKNIVKKNERGKEHEKKDIEDYEMGRLDFGGSCCSTDDLEFYL